MFGSLHTNNERNKMTEVLLRSAVKTEHFGGVCQVRLLRGGPMIFPIVRGNPLREKKSKKMS